MKIVVDLQSCQSGSRFGGIGRYSMNLLQAMARNKGNHDIHVVLSDLLPGGIPDIYRNLEGLIPKSNIHIFKLPKSISEQTQINLSRARAADIIREAYILMLNPDIIHVTSLFEGLCEDVSTSVHQLTDRSDVLTAVTLYDLIPLVEKEKYLSADVAFNHYNNKVQNLRRSDLLLSISDFSRQESLEILQIEPENVINISSAADERFRPVRITPEESRIILKKYGISKKFAMYTGSFDQRKNHKKLIEAFALVDRDVRKNHQLVVVGNGWEGIYKSLRSHAKKYGIDDGDIVFLGKVPDEDLLPLYNLCDLFVFPSLCEGFGLPVLEAMSCGVPVIGSNTTSVPEVLANDKALFDPTSSESISNKISKGISDKEFRQSLIHDGLVQSKNFSWDISAKTALNAFEDIYKKSQPKKDIKPVNELTQKAIEALKTMPEFDSLHDSDLVEISKCIEWIERSSEFKQDVSGSQDIGWITSWNSRCGIAMYSKYLIDDKEPSILAPKNEVQQSEDKSNVTRCWKLADDDLTELFNVILERRLKSIIIQFNYGFFNFKALSEFIDNTSSLGIRVHITLHSTIDPGDPEKQLQSLVPALHRCEQLLVHTTHDIKRLEDLGLKNVRIFNQGVFLPSKRNINFKIDKDAFIIGSYGFSLPNKGLKELVLCFHQLLRDGYNVHLLMINALYPDPVSENLIEDIDGYIKSNDLKDKVTLINDFLDENLSIGMLENADLIVFPYQKTNESSSAAVRMAVAAEKPIAVTPLPIFDEFNDFTFKLPGTSVNDLSTGIRDLIKDFNSKSDIPSDHTISMKDWAKQRAYPELSREIFSMLSS